VRHLLDVFQPLWSLSQRPTDCHLVCARDDLPDVAKEKEPNDGERDARETVLATTADGAVAATEVATIVHDAGVRGPAAGDERTGRGAATTCGATAVHARRAAARANVCTAKGGGRLKRDIGIFG
jgi:hypothetical protein